MGEITQTMRKCAWFIGDFEGFLTISRKVLSRFSWSRDQNDRKRSSEHEKGLQIGGGHPFSSQNMVSTDFFVIWSLFTHNITSHPLLRSTFLVLVGGVAEKCGNWGESIPQLGFFIGLRHIENPSSTVDRGVVGTPIGLTCRNFPT